MKVILLYINKNKAYKQLLKATSYSIENYIAKIQDVVNQDLKDIDNNIDLSNQNDMAMLMQYYTGNCDLTEFAKKIKLILYAKFLIKMHRDVIEYKLQDFKQQHQAEYLVYCSEISIDYFCGDLIWFISDLYDKEV